MMQKQKIKYRDHEIMTFHAGEGDEGLLLLSGGPGCPSDFLQDLHAHYANSHFKVVTWDQLGCGLSDRITDKSLWNIPRFVEEVEAVREYYGLKKVHLLGQSWGGVLGLEYCLAYPEHVSTFIITSSAFNIPVMQRGFERHRLALGQETMRMIARREGNRTTDHPEYQAAFMLLAYRHICRCEVWPESLKASLDIHLPMLGAVFGNYLFNCTGLLRNYDRTNDLHKIKQPCLIIHGEYDYIIPECATITHDYLPNSELHIMKDCSHTTFFEDPENYHRILGDFLVKHSKGFQSKKLSLVSG